MPAPVPDGPHPQPATIMPHAGLCGGAAALLLAADTATAGEEPLLHEVGTPPRHSAVGDDGDPPGETYSPAPKLNR
jgi:hypothetical protein